MNTNSVFVDTSGWMAYLVAGEAYHAQAIQELDHALGNPSIAIYTTDHVLAELVALMLGRKIPRSMILRDVDGLLIAPRIVKLFTDQTLFDEAWALLQQRADKEWSLADAISILRMQQLGVTEVLTNDHHFTQAGFARLLT
jgi:predicted nucleic acid-binding protein